MGRFGNKVSAEIKKRSSEIKVNKYEIPANALKIIAKICKPQNKDSDEMFDSFMPVWEAIYVPKTFQGEEVDFIEFCEGDGDFKFWHNLNQSINDIQQELAAHENNNSTQVVVAGAFSSGKSSFINTILGHTGLLPNGVEPVSVVNTFIFCSSSAKEISVHGVNLKNALVKLDTDILQCIQHSSKSNVYLASVLDKLFVEIPANPLTKGLAFIDTPGYNKSDAANESNGTTDEATATAAFDKGNVLFWVIDIEAGTTTDADEGMLNKFLEKHGDNGKVVIIYNKADKKPANDIKNIVNDTARKFKVGQDNRYIDVVAFSSVDNSVWYSSRGNSLNNLFEKVRAAGTGYSAIDNELKFIESMFDNRIEYHQRELNGEGVNKGWNQILRDAKKKKQDDYESLHNIKEGNEGQLKWFKGIMLDTYDQILDGANQYFKLASSFRSEVVDSVNAVFKYGSAQWGDGDSYDYAVDRAIRIVNEFPQKLDTIDYRYYEYDNRKSAYEAIETRYNWIVDRFKYFYDSDCEAVDRYQNYVNNENDYIQAWSGYKRDILTALRNSIAKYNRKEKTVSDARLNDHKSDIFEAIATNKYDSFENCFGDGVNLMDFNPEGYSALTYAVKCGANDMVKFMIEHNADLHAYDNRGYNSFQTAVENNFKDICQMLLDVDASLSSTKSKKGESIMEIASKNTFESWLKTKI